MASINFINIILQSLCGNEVFVVKLYDPLDANYVCNIYMHNEGMNFHYNIISDLPDFTDVVQCNYITAHKGPESNILEAIGNLLESYKEVSVQRMFIYPDMQGLV